MACKKYIYAAGDTAWVTTFMEGTERSWKGLSQVTLTNYDSTVACSIAEGSVLEVAGSLYIATSNCAIGTAGISTALQYIQAIGSTGGCVFSYNATAPTWRDDYQGYYASAASTTRVVGGIYYTGSYTEKWVYGKPKDMTYTRASGSLRPIKIKVVQIGDWDMDTNGTKAVAHGLDNINGIKSVTATVRNDQNNALYILGGAFTTDLNYAYCDLVVNGIDTTDITLQRVLSPGKFDSTNYNSITYNRGWINIQYEDNY